MRKRLGSSPNLLLLFITLLAIFLLAILPPGTESDPSGRQTRSGQISLEDVVPGVFLYKVGRDYKYEVLILSAPYNVDGMCRFDSLEWSDSQEFYGIPENSFCADFGLTPYGPGSWNQFNYLIRSERQPMSEEMFEELMQALFDAQDPIQVPEPPETLVL